jgi:hypothetical protein
MIRSAGNGFEVTLKAVRIPTDVFLQSLMALASSESADIATGVIWHIAPFVSAWGHTFNQTQRDAFWHALVNLSCFVSESPDLEGLLTGIEELALRSSCIHRDYLYFLADRSITAFALRAHLFVSLYDFYPPRFFGDNSEFFARLLPVTLSNGVIESRARQLQVMFAMHLTCEQLCSVEGLPEAFWTLLLEMSDAIGIGFRDFDAPVGKLKILVPEFFAMANPIIDSALEQLQDPSSSFQQCVHQAANFASLFPFLNRVAMLSFLESLRQLVDGAPDSDLPLLKEISIRFQDSLPNRLSEDQIRGLFDTMNRQPDSSGKFFLTAQFWTVFSEIDCGFASSFVDSICGWLEHPSFSPIVFSLIAECVVPQLRESQAELAQRLVPILYELLDLPNAQAVHFAMRAFREFWREGILSPDRFLPSLLEIIKRAAPACVWQHFKLIDELINSENAYACAEVKMFVAQSLRNPPSDPLSLAALVDTAATLETPSDHPTAGGTFAAACQLLATHNPAALPVAFRYIACYARSAQAVSRQVFVAPFRAAMEVITAATLPQKELKAISYWAAVLAAKFENRDEFHFQENLIDAQIEMGDPGVHRAVTILQKIWKRVAVPAACVFLEKVVRAARKTECVRLVNAVLSLMISMAAAHHRSFVGTIIEFKQVLIQGKLAIFGGFPIWQFDDQSFRGFLFLKKIQKSKMVLSVSEVYDLAACITLMKATMLPLTDQSSCLIN